MYRSTINSYSRVERMNKFNEQKQIEETTAFQENQAMDELNNEQQFTSMAHKRRVERLQSEVNKLDKPTGDGFSEYKLTLDQSSKDHQPRSLKC